MEADLHIHTNRYSGCSNIDPVEALKRARQVGLGVIALTEHGIRWPDAEIEALVDRSGVEDVLVIPGQEVACYSNSGEFEGEFLVFGYPESLGSSKSVQKVIDMVHTEGGVVIAAHPFKKLSYADGFYGAGHSISELSIDGLEIEHPSYDEESRILAREVMISMNIAGIGCSDAHDLNVIGSCRTIFSARVDDENALCKEIRAGRPGTLNLRK